MAACFKTTSPVLPFESAPVLGEGGWGGGGGGGGRRREGCRPAAFRALEISPLTEVAAATGDNLFGPTSERDVDVDGGRRRCGLLQMGWISSFFFLPFFKQFLRFGSDLEIVSICLLFIEFFISILGSSKIVHGWSFFCQGNLCIFHA